MAGKKEQGTHGITILSFGNHQTYCDATYCLREEEDCDECPVIESHRRAEELIRKIVTSR